tara:strand:- start:10 stop:1758 length:1749 start_codon:yes stop_codon:yes gene_type:complete
MIFVKYYSIVFGGLLVASPAIALYETNGTVFNKEESKQYVTHKCYYDEMTCALAISSDGAFGTSTQHHAESAKTDALRQCRMVASKPETCKIVDVNAESDFIAGLTEQKTSLDTTSVDLEFWQTVKESDDEEMLKAYLLEFPNGKFRSLATIKLKRLAASEDADTSKTTVSRAVMSQVEKGCYEAFHQDNGQWWQQKILRSGDIDASFDLIACLPFLSSDMREWIGSSAVQLTDQGSKTQNSGSQKEFFESANRTEDEYRKCNSWFFAEGFEYDDVRFKNWADVLDKQFNQWGRQSDVASELSHLCAPFLDATRLEWTAPNLGAKKAKPKTVMADVDENQSASSDNSSEVLETSQNLANREWCITSSGTSNRSYQECLNSNGIPTQSTSGWISDQASRYLQDSVEQDKAFAISTDAMGASAYWNSEGQAVRRALLNCFILSSIPRSCRVVNVNGRYEEHTDTDRGKSQSFGASGAVAQLAGTYDLVMDANGVDGTLRVENLGGSLEVKLKTCIEGICASWTNKAKPYTARGRTLVVLMERGARRAGWDAKEVFLRVAFSHDTKKVDGNFGYFQVEGRRRSGN